MTWEWNIARSPKYSINEEFHMDGKRFQLNANIEKGVIKFFSLKLEGNQMVFSEFLLNTEMKWDDLRGMLLSRGLREDLVDEVLSNLF